MTPLTLDRFAVSPCSNPELALDEALARYADLGFRTFEAFTSWAGSALDYHQDPASYIERAKRRGMRFVSLHLPPVKDDRDESLNEAVAAMRFAEGLGVDAALFKATSRPNYIAAGKPFLDATAGLRPVPVLQNHFGTPITTLDDFREVIAGIGDRRMRTLLEVGHFHLAGVTWRQGWDLLGDSVALVHIKDMAGPKPVAFGEGEVDLPGLFRHLAAIDYGGHVVVEMEAARGDTERTLQLLRDARAYIQRVLEEIQS